MISYYLPEGVSELTYAVGVDERVHDRICMRKDYSQVHDKNRWPFTLRTKQSETVDDVQRQPAHSKQANDDGQRLGGMDLFLQGGAGLELARHGLGLDAFELVARSHEDPQVNGQHEKQRQQHAGEEVEVDHIVHDHHLLEQTLHHAGRAVGVVDGLL